MASSRKWRWIWISPLTVAVAAAVISIFAGATIASQGPGGGPGTASPFLQLVVAIVVYGAAALIVGVGLIGALRKR